ncbi:ParB/RepB/Spo0J family partition protein [Acidocella aminolytica]|jgi:ParB family chromosome partitioning protein|uniref:Chromosome partitioning nuclease protein ParB n=1 Tax=Acidocella aminolytica 101 = DSM 11237 TaxID=1120923 RepID=A0A0D6PFS3_9PROT|nr:ParB/RepB/Spo0J family partition protein [Acidocella aminolytica]GAN79684.1 chromosome partitioning nuclease protein ParB [Acidocella aminolytica 101 = DSM 11237]GBQ41197.1 chromosome partitioning protein ParB [Acidocella aminolytica 101 = DSM 11237]SHF04712.1 chromosome partitioning protein, ParB family [Acidocella aminolytica 101 = DSM 11237]
MSGKEPRKPLGRGLAALLGEAATPTSVTAFGVQHLAVDLLEPSPFQPRQEMEESALQELADSISQRGILQPLLVRPKPGVVGHYQIIAGERRWRASQRAQVHEVPVLVRDLSDADAMAAGLVENLQRENLNAVEEAEGYKRLIEEFKLSHDKLGEAVGKSRSHITNVMRLLQLPTLVQTMLKEGQITTGHAKALLAHPEPLKVAREVVAKELSVRQTEALAKTLGRSIVQENATRKPREHKTEDSEIATLAKSLSERLGVKVDIKFNGKGGSLTLNYADLDQLDSLLALLNK